MANLSSTILAPRSTRFGSRAPARVRNDGAFEEPENFGTCDDRFEKFNFSILNIIEEDDLLQEEAPVEVAAEFPVGHADDFCERRMPAITSGRLLRCPVGERLKAPSARANRRRHAPFNPSLSTE